MPNRKFRTVTLNLPSSNILDTVDGYAGNL